MDALVYGLAIAGASTVRALQRRGHEVTVADDVIDDAKQDLANALGVELLPTPLDPGAFVRQFDLVVPAPGLPERHAVIAAAQAIGVPLRSEIELAYRWEHERAHPRPMLAVTGTDGKTTTTDMTVAMLRAAGLNAVGVGNTEVPFVDRVDDDAVDAFVVECSSFRLAWTEQFRGDGAAWLNLAPDHLNWHESFDTYVAAKAKVFEQQRSTDVAVGFVGDPVVMSALAAAPSRSVTFGLADADYRLEGDQLVGPSGPIVSTADMGRALPHDITNALAAAALVLETGLAPVAAVAAALADFQAQPHRLEPVGTHGGVTWYNDSKATTPHAAAAAVRAFDSLILIAGGSRKGVDLAPMAEAADRVKLVVAIGEAMPDVHDAFAGHAPITDATSMDHAVSVAAEHAEPGDAVVLSPGCASFDWYGGYPERGDHFRRLVHDLISAHHPPEPRKAVR